ncbi:MAG: DNA translocase FtsK 4TM domain-containing protein [bacterium]|nr:DNA translocase FtsK 4TM domain-containing protein [bacterium]
MARGRRRLLKFNLKPASIRSTAVILLLLLSLLTALSFFIEDAAAIVFLQGHLTRFFGYGLILLPPIFLISGLVLIRSRRFPLAEPRILGGLVLALISLTLSAQRFAGQGGLVGNFLWLTLSNAFSAIGALFITIALWLTSFLVLFNTSLESFFSLLAAIGRVLAAVSQKMVIQPVLAIAHRLVKPRQEKKPVAEEKTTEVEEPFAIIPPPSEPVVISTGKMATAVSSEEPLRQETVTNMPYAQKVWEYPPIDLLSDNPPTEANRGDVKANAQIIEKTLDSFGIRAHVVEVNLGPAVTQYALESAQGTKIARITNLQNDLAMALASPTGTIRLEAPIPGKSLIGIEVPNLSLSIVPLKSVLLSEEMRKQTSKLAVSLGHNVAGRPVVADIGKMPHILVAGATGSGKSVLLHSFIATLLFRCSPQEVKFILIDPKRVELPQYNEIPHLLTPVIVEPEKAIPALKWVLAEMTRRYKLFENAKARNINAYNELSGFQALPYILVIVDELADLMATAPVEIEKTICRLAQMARATGIHLILATQRPSVDVLTGLIKANVTCRIAFNVTSQVDSRVIIDQVGAEKLLGRGDMLYVPPDVSKPIRIQGVYVSDKELNGLLKFMKGSQVKPEYESGVTTFSGGGEMTGLVGGDGSRDDLFADAVDVICNYDRASASLLQRRLKVGYARAARLLDELEAAGVVGPADGSKPREVLMKDPQTILNRQAPAEGQGKNDSIEEVASVDR